MESKVNYTIVGLIVVILTIGLISTSLWLSVGFNQKNYKYYLVYMSETVSGLSEQSPVKYNGVQVGYVQKIDLDKHDPRLVRLLLAIEEHTPITTSTSATLISQGITGTTYVGLSASSASLQPLPKRSDEPYPVIPTTPSLFNQLDRVLKEVSVNINEVSIEIKKILDNENAAYIKKTLSNLETFTNIFADQKQTINKSIVNADIVLRNLAKISDDLPAITRDLRTSVNKISHAGDTISITMDSGKIALDKFSQQTIPPAINLIERLNRIAANLERVSSQMRQNPAVIIRGTKPPKPGPGE